MRMIKYKRVASLREDLGWRDSDGTPFAFFQFLSTVIAYMPPKMGEAMRRYYLHGDSQTIDPETGRPLAQDARFYQLTMHGRDALRTILTLRRAGLLEGRLFDDIKK